MEMDVHIFTDNRKKIEITIDDLPDEILTKIFSNLNFQTIKTRISGVCRRWCNLAKSKLLMKYVTILPDFDTENVVFFLNESKYLNKLEFFSRNDVNEILENILDTNYDKLKALKFNTYKDETYTLMKSGLLLNFLQRCRRLRSLILKRTSFDNAKDFFQHFFFNLPDLTKINLNHSVQLGTLELEMIITISHPLEDVRLYALSYNRLGSVTPYENAPVSLLCDKMKETLKILKLNMLGLTDEVMLHISQCSNLKRLHMYKTVGVHDEGFSLLAQLEELQELVVTLPRAITTLCWLNLFCETNFKYLITLNISNSYSVNDKVLYNIATNCSQLRSLSLPGCRQITSRGMSWIITSCHSLIYLNLYSTRACVSDSFTLIPQYLPKLKVLIYRAVNQSNYFYKEVLRNLTGLDLKETYRYT